MAFFGESEMKPIYSFLIGAGVGYLGYKFLLGGKTSSNTGIRRNLGVVTFYPHRDDWESEMKAKAIMQTLAGVRPGILGDIPHSMYGGYEGLPSFASDPTFLVPYDPDGPKDDPWFGHPWDGFPSRFNVRGGPG
jgi:hypothetical protein